MSEVKLSNKWCAVACTACRNLEGDYCHGWQRRVGAPLDQAVRLCKRYEPKGIAGLTGRVQMVDE